MRSKQRNTQTRILHHSLNKPMKAKVVNSKIIPDNTHYFNDTKKRLEGKDIRLEIEEWKDTRTLAQNRFLWKYYGLIRDDSGHKTEYLHEFFKQEFLQPKLIKVFGKIIKKAPSTTRLSKKAFSEYIRKIEERTDIHFPFNDEL